MAYIGLPPKANFTSGLLDRFTSTTGTTVTLTHDISSENDIVVFVNFVKQDSTTYSVGGTGNKTLTLGGTLVSSDIVEVHYLNIVGQTVNPSANSVGSSQLTADSITGQTAETSIADDDTIIIHDTSASALRKMTKSNFVSGIGGTNTPSFHADLSSTSSINDNTVTDIVFDSENFDNGSCYNNSTGIFTVPSGEAGKYFIGFNVYYEDNNGNVSDMIAYIHTTISSSASQNAVARAESTSNGTTFTELNLNYSTILDLGVGDQVKVQAYIDTNNSSAMSLKGGGNKTTFFGYKIIE